MAKRAKAGSSSIPSTSRPKSASSLAQEASSAAGILTAFCDFGPAGEGEGSLFAQVTQAVDADTVRIFDVSSGQCIGRWASADGGERVVSLAWTEIEEEELDSNETKTVQTLPGKKRRKSSSSVHAANSSIQALDDLQQKSKGKQSSKGKESNKDYIKKISVLALGLSSGSIHILHPSQSSIIQTLSHQSSSKPILSLSFPSSRLTQASSSLPPFLWSSSASGRILLWSLPTLAGPGGRLLAAYEDVGLSCNTIAVRYITVEKEIRPDHSDLSVSNGLNGSNHHGQLKAQLLVAQQAIRLFVLDLPYPVSLIESSIQTPPISLKANFTGHTTNVSQLLWLSIPPSTSIMHTNGYTAPTLPVCFLSSAISDRFIFAWTVYDLDSSTTAVSDGRLAGTLGLEDDVRRMCVSRPADILCAVSMSGSVALSPILPCIFTSLTKDSQKSNQKRKKNVTNLQVVSSVTMPVNQGPLTDAFFSSTTANRTLRLSKGTVRPGFEEVLFRNEDGSFISLLRTDLGSSKPVSSVDIVGNGSEQRVTYLENEQAVVNYAGATHGQASPNNTALSKLTNDATLAERLNSLQMEQAANQDKDNPFTSRRLRRSINGKKRIADAMSLSQMLGQALHSTDIKLLESCLQHSDPKVIRSTVSRLPNALVLSLIEALVERLSRSRKGFSSGSGGVDAIRGQVLIEWLRNLLVVHLTYLVTLPSLINRLAPLNAVLSSRMFYHQQLLALSGRLDLVTSQIELKGAGGSSSSSITPTFRNHPSAATTGSNKYIEGESTSSSEGNDETVLEHSLIPPAAEERGEIEDLEMERSTSDEGEEGDDSKDAFESSNESLAETQDASLPKINGFMDLEAEESVGEDSDVETVLRRSLPVDLADAEHEDDDDEAEDLDEYESDFINDEEEEGDGSDEDDDDE